MSFPPPNALHAQLPPPNFRSKAASEGSVLKKAVVARATPVSFGFNIVRRCDEPFARHTGRPLHTWPDWWMVTCPRLFPRFGLSLACRIYVLISIYRVISSKTEKRSVVGITGYMTLQILSSLNKRTVYLCTMRVEGLAAAALNGCLAPQVCTLYQAFELYSSVFR
jgi:hypothetical protein